MKTLLALLILSSVACHKKAPDAPPPPAQSNHVTPQGVKSDVEKIQDDHMRQVDDKASEVER